MRPCRAWRTVCPWWVKLPPVPAHEIALRCVHILSRGGIHDARDGVGTDAPCPPGHIPMIFVDLTCCELAILIPALFSIVSAIYPLGAGGGTSHGVGIRCALGQHYRVLHGHPAERRRPHESIQTGRPHLPVHGRSRVGRKGKCGLVSAAPTYRCHTTRRRSPPCARRPRLWPWSSTATGKRSEHSSRTSRCTPTKRVTGCGSRARACQTSPSSSVCGRFSQSSLARGARLEWATSTATVPGWPSTSSSH